MLVNPSVPAHSIAELIALAKQQEGKLTFGSTGTGSSVHLAAELFAGMAGREDHPCAVQRLGARAE